MEQVITIRLNIAKPLFQLRAGEAGGQALFDKRITHRKLIGLLSFQGPCIAAL
jgi:hypothetical protein